MLPSPTTRSCPAVNAPTGEAHSLQPMNQHWHVTISQSPQFRERSLSALHFLWVWTGDMYPPLSYLTERSHCLKNLRGPMDLPFPTNFRQPLISLSIALSSLQHSGTEIIRYVVSSHWLLPLGDVRLHWLHVFVWLDSSFLSSAK